MTERVCAAAILLRGLTHVACASGRPRDRAATFKVAQGMVEALTAPIAALIALAAVLGIQKNRSSRQGS
jgi:hypothetical protein